MTRYYVCYTTIHPQVKAAVPPDTVWVNVAGDDHAYWRALCDIWEKGEDFALIEHDVVPHKFVTLQFEECDEPWCSFGYHNICHPECQEAWANQLGCTRFRAEIMQKCPDAVSGLPPDLRGWHNLCDHIAGNKIHGTDTPELAPGSMRAAGFTHHWHFPPVGHHPWRDSK